MMKYPELIRRQYCTTPCTVVLYGEEITPDGTPEVVFSGELRCCFQSSARVVRNTKHEEVTLSGEAFFCGDICPELPEITSGEITVFGKKREIVSGMKARNPDGSVNYTRLGVA